VNALGGRLPRQAGHPWTKKASRVFPAAISAASHFGGFPRPVHVSFVEGCRYLIATGLADPEPVIFFVALGARFDVPFAPLASKSAVDTPSFFINCVFRPIVTDHFGSVTADFGIVTGHFGIVTEAVQ